MEVQQWEAQHAKEQVELDRMCRITTRSERNARQVKPMCFELWLESNGLWYESKEEIEAGLAYGARKAALLHWLEEAMTRVLTAKEQECLRLYFLEEMPYRQLGAAANISAATALRAVRRAVLKLQAAAREDDSWR